MAAVFPLLPAACLPFPAPFQKARPVKTHVAQYERLLLLTLIALVALLRDNL